MQKATGRKAVKGIRQGDRFHCPGCNKDKTYSARGLCEACRKTKYGKHSVKQVPVVSVVATPSPPPLPESCGKVDNAAGEQVSFGIDPDIHTVIRVMLSDVEQRLLVDVSGMPFAQANLHVCRCVGGMAQAVAQC